MLINKVIRLVLIINDNSQTMIRLIGQVLIINDLVGVIILRCGLCEFWGSSSWFVTLLDSSLCSTLCSKPTRCQEFPIISLWYFFQELGLLVLVVLVAILTYSSLVCLVQSSLNQMINSLCSYSISVLTLPGVLCRERKPNFTRRPGGSQLYWMGWRSQ